MHVLLSLLLSWVSGLAGPAVAEDVSGVRIAALLPPTPGADDKASKLLKAPQAPCATLELPAGGKEGEQ